MKRQLLKNLLSVGMGVSFVTIPTYALTSNIERSQELSFSRSNLEILPKVTLEQNLWALNETIVFIHPPKTAGTNLVNLMDAISKIKPDVTVKRAAVPRIPGRSPNLFTEGSLGGLSKIMHNADDFNGKQKHSDFISGHMPIPELQYESKFFGTHHISYIGLVRNPIDRELSLANFDFQRRYIEKADVVSYLLEKTIDNPQTRLIAGQEAMTGKCTTDTLEKAKKNIQSRFKFIAPSEEIAVVMSIVANHFGLSNVAYASAQVTGLKAIEIADQDLRLKLAEKHQYDVELYDWVKSEWMIWKSKNIKSIAENTNVTEPYLSLLPDFAQTKNPTKMYRQQISEYNKVATSNIISLQQKHNGISHADKVISSRSNNRDINR